MPVCVFTLWLLIIFGELELSQSTALCELFTPVSHCVAHRNFIEFARGFWYDLYSTNVPIQLVICNVRAPISDGRGIFRHIKVAQKHFVAPS